MLKTTLSAEILSGLSFGGVFLAFALVNLHFAYHAAAPVTKIRHEKGNIYQLKSDQAAQFLKPLSITISFLLAIFAGKWGAAQWQNGLLFANGINVGIADPVMGKDIGFYLFSIPLLEQINGFVGFMVPVTALMVAALFYLNGGVAVSPQGVVIDAKLRRHLAILAALFFLSVAAGFYLIQHLFEAYWLYPKVMKRRVNISTGSVVVAILIGGALLGVVGALLAVPIAAAVQLIVREVVFPVQDSS